LERTIGDRPTLVAAGGEEAVDEKVHDLVDEAWSLVADSKYDLDRRELAGRALVIGSELGWPASAPVAAAVLDDVLRKDSARGGATQARAALALLEGDAARALSLARAAAGLHGSSARAIWIEARALAALGRGGEAEVSRRRF